MPILACCQTNVPSLLNMSLYIWGPDGIGCFSHGFTLLAKGGVWVGNDTWTDDGSTSSMDVQMGATGPNPSDLLVKLKLTFNPGCGVNLNLPAYATCGEGTVSTMVGWEPKLPTRVL